MMTKIIFVADAYAKDYPFGGAELTTEAILKKSKLPIKRLYSHEVNENTIKENLDYYWIFGNFYGVKENVLLQISQKINYSILEYDYKYCIYRSSEIHELSTKNKCNCHNEKRGKIVSIFFNNAKHLFWMSEAQKNFYLNLFPFLSKKDNIVLSSVFDEDDLQSLESLDTSNKNDKWIILSSKSLIKGISQSIEYAKKNKLNYELVGNLSRKDLLEKLSVSKGLIFQPFGKDTCPRLVIEAKLLDCELIINDNVQHGKEEWFNLEKKEIISYLKNRPELFWSVIYKDISFASTKQNNFLIVIPCYNVENWVDKNFNSVKQQNYKNFKCVYIDDISDDSTVEKIKQNIQGNDRFSLIINTDKKYALENIYNGIKYSNPDDDTIIITVDGDDWLYDENVLEKLNNVYQDDNLLLTYGKHITYPENAVSDWVKEYPESVVKQNSFREFRWFASHLRTFKYKLWKNIKLDDLKDGESFYKVTWDMAMMFPMLEMCNGNFRSLDDIMYVYNRETPLNDDKVNRQQQLLKEQEIRLKNKYEALK